MSAPSAPYRFVPASPLVVLPDWAEQVSHDVPFADGLCGELDITLRNDTPMCVGGKQSSATEQRPGRVYCFRTPSGEPAIPGSSIKGMLRNVLKIASFGHFDQVEDQKLGVRDITEAGNFYFKAAPSATVRAGWLSFVDGQWRITGCDFSRLDQQDLLEACDIRKADWKRCNTAPARYELIGVEQQINFRREHMIIPSRESEWQAIPDANGNMAGVIVVTGQPGKAFDESDKAKKFEFVFHTGGEIAPWPVSSEVMNGFFRIHEESDEWRFWDERQKADELAHGVPVFFHATGNAVTSLGLAMMYKVPYKLSLHDAIRNTAECHLDNAAPDLADLILGRLDDEPGQSLRGRVNIGCATTDSLTSGWEGKLEQPTVLNSPKPTFYPAYIRQHGKARAWKQLMDRDAQLAGWKRYPAKPADILPPPPKSRPSVQVQLETVPAKTRFQFKLRFHNLRPVELGAVLWCLDFGKRPTVNHGLGAGKPYGLGQVCLEINQDETRLRANDASLYDADEKDVLDICRASFADFMDQALRQSGVDAGWEASGPIQALLEMGYETSDTGALEYLREPKHFAALKKTGETKNIENLVTMFHDTQPLQAVQPEAAHTYEARLDQHLADVIDERKQEEATAAREHTRAQATEEDRLLMELADLIGGSGDKPGKTQMNKIAKRLNKVAGLSDNLDSAQAEKARDLAAAADALGSPKISHAARKI